MWISFVAKPCLFSWGSGSFWISPVLSSSTFPAQTACAGCPWLRTTALNKISKRTLNDKSSPMGLGEISESSISLPSVQSVSLLTVFLPKLLLLFLDGCTRGNSGDVYAWTRSPASKSSSELKGGDLNKSNRGCCFHKFQDLQTIMPLKVVGPFSGNSQEHNKQRVWPQKRWWQGQDFCKRLESHFKSRPDNHLA